MIKTILLSTILIAFSSILNLCKAQTIRVDSSRFSVYYWHSKDMFDNLPDISDEIIFLGNSITDGAEWFELLSNNKCLNRGISGDVVDGVLLRLDAITRCKPGKVFLMIGVNDLAKGETNEFIISKILEIAKRIKNESPETALYIQSILPVNPNSGMFKNHTDKSDNIIYINSELKAMADSNAYKYIDLHSSFTDSNGFLKMSFTLDGLHLNYTAYKAWSEIIKTYIVQ